MPAPALDLSNLTPVEMQRRLHALREQLRDLRFKVDGGQHKDVRDLRDVRRNIARILTKLNQPQPTETKHRPV